MKLLFVAFFSIVCLNLLAEPSIISKHIKIDQFGYLPNSKKIAVIADPQVGFNASESFSPGTGINQYQVRRWDDNTVVYSGTLVVWNGGSTHAQSGDRGWWFDFSTINTPGSYYIFDLANNVGSFRFEIGNNVYASLLKVACRMYFYQRVNQVKQPPYVDARWSDATSFDGANQDRAARSRWDKTNPTTARDVHGGWYDAGDYNKYITFAGSPMCNLMETYRMHPNYFTDDYNIPESGNGIPDILDEVKWEMDFFKRMQDASGTNGLFLKVGADNFNSASPPSNDLNPRYYVPECTSSTITGAAVFALGSTIYKSLGNAAMTIYGNDLQTRAINAWNRAKITTSNFNNFQTSCDDQNIVAGDADQSIEDQQDMIVTAALYLWEATGSAEYKNAFDTMYIKSRPISFYWWGPYFAPVHRALLRYTNIPGSDIVISNNIRSIKSNQDAVLSLTDYSAGTDLYRSFMPDAQYHWNSHEVKANAGLNNLDFVSFGINTGQSALYQETAESYLHWFHGVNPFGKVMLTNMYAYGADSSVNEFYHAWFGNGTVWDNVFTSANGPAPGYLIGGPNKDFSVPGISPPGGQPPQKSYREWNTGWNGSFTENSWEITEAGIYTQAAYISLLVRVMANAGGTVLSSHILGISATRDNKQAKIYWQTDGKAAGTKFDLERSFNGSNFKSCYNTVAVEGFKNYSYTDASAEILDKIIYYRIKETSESGKIYYSQIVKLNVKGPKTIFSVYPNPATKNISIAGETPISDDLFLMIHNSEGRMVKKISWSQSAGSFSKSIPLDDLPAGIYWVRLIGKHLDEKVKISKL